jgi:hypothetical protein
MNSRKSVDLMACRTTLLLLAVMFTMVCTSGCVHPAYPSWRLTNNVLTPPGISRATVTQRTVRADAGEHPACPPGVRARRKQVLVSVSHDNLSKQPPGWLTAWTEDLEAQGCIAPGEAFRLASDIAQSLPLEMNAAFHLLYPNDRYVVKIHPHVRLQIMMPIMKEGADPDAPIIETETAALSGNTVSINGRFTDNVLGYETAWYSAQARSQSPGVSIAPVSTERHINGQTERVPLPIHDYFRSLSSASFYGLFYKGGETAFTALIVGAPTKAELERRTNMLQTGIASCETLNNDTCVTIPKQVAINPMVQVTVNGTEMLLNWGATLRSAIGADGERQPNTLLPQLSVFKPYGGRPVLVEFDHRDPAILNLILMGGETISWK